MTPIPIPQRLERRPVFRGMAVPFTTLIGPDGIPDFRANDVAKHTRALMRRWCGLCGEPLGRVIVFIGSEVCVKTRIFYDVASHPECAAYATKACPFLANADHSYATAERNHPGLAITARHLPTERPAVMILYYTSDYRMVKIDGLWHSLAKAPIRVVRDAMPRREQKR